MAPDVNRTLRVNYSKELGKWRVEGRTGGFGQFDKKSTAKNKANQVWQDKTDLYTRLIIERRDGSRQTVKTRSGVTSQDHDEAKAEGIKSGFGNSGSKTKSSGNGGGILGALGLGGSSDKSDSGGGVGGILGDIGSGGKTVMDDIESGDFDPVGLEDDMGGSGGSGGNLDGLDMDLEDFD